MRLKRWIIVALVAAAVVLAIAYGFIPSPVPSDIVSVSRGPLLVTVEEEGKTRVVDRFVVSAPVAGYMRRVALEAGDAVKKGQAVAEIEPLWSATLDPRSRAAAQAAVLAAESVLGSAEENLRAAVADAEFARSKFERTQKLYEGGFVPQNTLDQATSDAKRTEANRLSAEASVKTALHELEKARAALAYSGTGDRKRAVAVRTPVAGKVLKVWKESAGVVSPGEPILDIGDPARIEVKVEVLSADAVKLGPGTPVLFDRWGGDGPLAGVVKVVEPSGFTKISSLGVEEQRVNVIADITTPYGKRPGVGDGFRVDARFVLWEGTDVLRFPASALFRKGEAWAVFVVRNGRAREQPVTVGHTNGLFSEALSGLSEGDKVIAHPDESIRDGTRVVSR